jgi:hypothetical protein
MIIIILKVYHDKHQDRIEIRVIKNDMYDRCNIEKKVLKMHEDKK